MKTTGYIDIKGEDLDLVLAKMCSQQERVFLSLNQSHSHSEKTSLCALCVFSYFAILATQQSRCYHYPSYADEETETQRAEFICL